MMDWRKNLITEEEEILQLAGAAQRVAVLGIRSKKYAYKAAYYVAKYLDSEGVEIIPVPVHETEQSTIMDRPVYRKLEEIPGEIDIVDVFRRAEDIPDHLPDILAKQPKAVWFQLGIRNDDAAEVLAKAGIKVVQDRCLMVEHRRVRYLIED